MIIFACGMYKYHCRICLALMSLDSSGTPLHICMLIVGGHVHIFYTVMLIKHVAFCIEYFADNSHLIIILGNEMD